MSPAPVPSIHAQPVSVARPKSAPPVASGGSPAVVLVPLAVVSIALAIAVYLVYKEVRAIKEHLALVQQQLQQQQQQQQQRPPQLQMPPPFPYPLMFGSPPEEDDEEEDDEEEDEEPAPLTPPPNPLPATADDLATPAPKPRKKRVTIAEPPAPPAKPEEIKK